MSEARPYKAAVDIGSNSVKLLVGRVTEGRVEVVLDEVKVTRLSEGVDKSGALNPAAAERTLAALKSMVWAAKHAGATEIIGVGTSALRDATDARAFVVACAKFGLPVEIVDGPTEADIVRLAAVHELPGLSPDAVLVDIGGGSTEFVWPGGSESTELGVVRLTERHVPTDPPGDESVQRLVEAIDARLDQLALPKAQPDTPGEVVGSSASCSLVARLHLGLRRHKPALIHDCTVPLEAIESIGARLSAMTQAERLDWRGMDPGRADVLLAGVLVLSRLAARQGATGVRINDRGTRYGIFHRAFGNSSET